MSRLHAVVGTLALAVSAGATLPARADVLSQGQLQVAAHVFTGTAQCEFKQQVSLTAMNGQPGHFRLAFKNAHYDMVPVETSTGAVRLEDAHAGVVWLQIPAKSMLLNSRLGHRMLDDCRQAEQVAVAQGGHQLGLTTATAR
jgi:hypothetical protein